MSIPSSNALQSQITINNHFLHHPKVDDELTRKHEHGRVDTENIYLPPLARGNNHNYDGRSVIEIREPDISKESWPFNYAIEIYRELNGVTTTGRMLYRSLKIIPVSDEMYGGICKEAHTVTELAEGLRLNPSTKNPFDPAEDYTVHEITLGSGYNASDYAKTTIGYALTLPTLQAKRWTNEQPRIGIYIGQIMIVSGVVNFSGFALTALLNANIELGNDPIVGIKAYSGTAETHAEMGYRAIPGDESTPLKRMTL